MNPYYIFGFLLGVVIGTLIVCEYLPSINKIIREKKERQKELESKNPNSTFDL